MKWIGIVLVLGTTTWVGFDISSKFSNRVIHLRQFILSLQMLETEMDYSKATLRQIFENISKRTSYPINTFYENLAKELGGIIDDFVELWEIQMEELIKVSALNSNDLEIIKQFGKNLGMHHFSQQQKHIQLSIYHLKGQLEEAIDQCAKYEKMTKVLGVLVGLLFVILLF